MLILALAPACSDSGDGPSPGRSVTLANLNVLHGFDCDPPAPAPGGQCRINERVDLLARHLVERGCPDIVTLQEIVNRDFAPNGTNQPLDSLVTLIEEAIGELEDDCGFTYEMVYEPFLGQAVPETDEEMILSRYPVVDSQSRPLHSALYDEPNSFLIFARHLLYARIDHPLGAVDVYTTHLSSGSDAATNPCNSFQELIPGTGIGPSVECPVECDANDTVRACQAEQLALFVEATRGEENLVLISGDFNAVPGSSEYRSMTDRGWLDSHLVAGTTECDPLSGGGCTSGRNSSASSLENPALQVDRRIDYIFVAPAPVEGPCRARVIEGDLFAAQPNPFADQCGATPLAMCWVSDHSGNYASVACGN